MIQLEVNKTDYLNSYITVIIADSNQSKDLDFLTDVMSIDQVERLSHHSPGVTVSNFLFGKENEKIKHCLASLWGCDLV